MTYVWAIIVQKFYFIHEFYPCIAPWASVNDIVNEIFCNQTSHVELMIFCNQTSHVEFFFHPFVFSFCALKSSF